MTTPTIPINVQRGIARLDRMGPSNWRDLLRPHIDTLDVSYKEKCPCFYIFGSWEAGIRALDLQFGTGDISHYGFSGWGATTEGWKAYLRSEES